MNDFRLFAHGQAFDPDAFLAKGTLDFDGVWRKGELGHGQPQSGVIFKTLGNGKSLSIFDQDRIAIAYLHANRDALVELAKHPDVTTFILGLQYHIRLEASTVGFCFRGPSALLTHLCNAIGIDLTIYVTLDRPELYGHTEDN